MRPGRFPLRGNGPGKILSLSALSELPGVSPAPPRGARELGLQALNKPLNALAAWTTERKGLTIMRSEWLSGAVLGAEKIRGRGRVYA